MESAEMADFFSAFTFLLPWLHAELSYILRNFVFAGSSPVSRGKGVYNKGSLSLQ